VEGYFSEHYRGRGPGLAKRVFAELGCATRHGVVNPTGEDPSRWSTETRMERYLVEALPLGKDALSAALGQAGLAGSDVGQLVVCSCTGYVTPGWTSCSPATSACRPRPPGLRRAHGLLRGPAGLGVASDYVALNGARPGCSAWNSPACTCKTAHCGRSTGGGARRCSRTRRRPGRPGTGPVGTGSTEVASLTDTTTAGPHDVARDRSGLPHGPVGPVPRRGRAPRRAAHHRPAGPATGLDVSDRDRLGRAPPGGPRILDVVQADTGPQ
jgi:hypothetical protein